MSEQAPHNNWKAPDLEDLRDGPTPTGDQTPHMDQSEVAPFDISDIVGLDSNASVEETRRVIAERMSGNEEDLNEWQQMTDQELGDRYESVMEAISGLGDLSADRIKKNVKRAEIKAIEEELQNRGLSLEDIAADGNTDTNSGQSNTTEELSAPTGASDRVVRSFTDEEGNPVGTTRGLFDEMMKKVEDGDTVDWNNLKQTFRDALKNELNQNGAEDIPAKLKESMAVAEDLRRQAFRKSEVTDDRDPEYDSRRDEDTFGFVFNEETGEWEEQTLIPGFDVDPETQMPVVESDPGMLERLGATSDRYAYETAKSRRSYLGRFFSKEAKERSGLGKIIQASSNSVRRFGRFITSPINSRTDRDVVDAKNDYREMVDKVGADAAVKLREAGYNEDQIAHLSVLGRLEWDSRLEDGTSVVQQLRTAESLDDMNTELGRLIAAMREENLSEEELTSLQEQYVQIENQMNERIHSVLVQKGILQHRHEQSKEAGRFSNWWHRQKGITGVAKKYGGMFAAGVAAGAFLPATAAGLVGAGITAGSLELVRRMNQRRANADSGVDGLTVAQLHSREDKAAKRDLVNNEVDNILANATNENGEFDLRVIRQGLDNTNFESSIGITEKRTDEEMTANRRKFVAAAIAAVTGYTLGEIIDHATDSDLPNVGGDDDGGDTGPVEPESEEPVEPESEEPVEPEVDPEPVQPESEEPVQPEDDIADIVDGREDGLGEATNAEGVETVTQDLSQYEYPWNWASETYGEGNATAVLENLADRAAADGHDVEWHGTGTGRWIEIDGISVTSNAEGTGTLDVLTQYAAEMDADLQKLAEAQSNTLPVTS